MTSPVYRLAQGLALLGGSIMVLAMMVTLASTLGKNLRRALDTIFGPKIPGQASANFGGRGSGRPGHRFRPLMLPPLLHLNRGHIQIDLIKGHMPPWVNRALDALTDLSFAVLYALILWFQWVRVVKKARGEALGFWDYLLQFDAAGAASRFRRGDTQILQIPEAPLRLVAEGLILLAFLTALYCAFRSLQTLVRS